MLFTYRSLDVSEERVLASVILLRQQLRHHVIEQPRRWTGLLARMTRARAIMGSNSVEGINVSQEDAIAAVDGEEPGAADRETWREVVGYRSAMDYILQRCRDPQFAFTRDVILSVHFMITQYNLAANPGLLRPGWVGVRNSVTGEIVHEGVDRADLEPLLDELVGYMNERDGSDTTIRAAMAHLNLTLLHPFSDGNGRTARCLQTAVLALDGVQAPTFSSIEEYIGRNQQAYYDVLAQVGGGGWRPERDCKPWIRFCLTAHYRQAQTLLRRAREFEMVYADMEVLVRRKRLPERTALALVEAAFGVRVRNSSYRITADISNNLASRDLTALVEARLLIPEGEKRGRVYLASPEVQAARLARRMPRDGDDPFVAIPVSEPVQGSLFN